MWLPTLIEYTNIDAYDETYKVVAYGVILWTCAYFKQKIWQAKQICFSWRRLFLFYVL